jgi:1,4-alpha-glucan branching enzyme
MKWAYLLACACLVGCGLGNPGGDSIGDGTWDLTTPPLGAIPGDGGTVFAVWAPHAAGAAVEGDFNAWSDTVLQSIGQGIFSGFVSGAKPGDEYRFRLSPPDGGFLDREDPHAFAVSSAGGHAYVYDSTAFSWTSTFQPPPFNQQIIYELHIATFNDPSGTGQGTWQSAALKLDYLKSLGVNMIEIMPSVEFPGRYSWGYNPIFPFAPETNYGSPDDVKSFVDQAHARGIGVILDVVHNHWGGADLPMWCFDGPCFGAGNGGIYFYTDARRDTGFGPRPDYGRPMIRSYIVDNAILWLTDYRMDGLRWDSVVNIRTAAGQNLPDGWALLQQMNETVHAQTPGKIQIAEDLQNSGEITTPTSGGGAGFDSQWDPAFYYPVRAALIATSDAARSMAQVASAISHTFNGSASQRVVYTEDHDMVAFPQNGPDKGRMPVLISRETPGDYWARKRSTLGAAVALTVPGVPMLFMGQEFLDPTPFPFSPGKAINWSNATTYSGILQMYQRMIALRLDADGTTRGLSGNGVNVFHVNDNAKVVAFHRWDQGGPGDDVVVLANFSNTTFASYRIGLPRSGTWHVRFNSDSSAYSSDFHDTPTRDLQTQGPYNGLPFSGSMALGPYTVVIVSQ